MDYLLAMIAYFGFNFVPSGWLACNGQVLSIQQNAALFALLGTMYGGNGSTNFGLPDLRGRVVLGAGMSTASNTNYNQGNPAGNTETVTLTAAQMPSHSHSAAIGTASVTIKANSTAGVSGNPAGRNITLGALSSPVLLYNGTTPDVALNVGGGVVSGTVIVAPNGSSSPVSVMQPYCVLNACICTMGIFPSRD